MNREEQDWINALNATGNLANTLARTEAQGLQTDAYLKEKADKEKQTAVADWATTGISRGLDPNQLNKFESVPTNQAAWDSNYKDMNRGLKPGTSGYVAPENFSMSTDVKAGSSEIQTGVNEAMKKNIEAYKSDFEMKKNKVAPIIKSLPMDKLNTIDFEQFGDNAEAARAVFAEDIKTRSESAQYKKQFDDTIRAGIEQHWKGWSSSVGLADESIKKGNKVAAMAYANTAINVHNSDSRKFEVNPDTGTSGKFYIIQQGEKVYDDKEYNVESLLKMMKEITPQQFNEHNWTAAKESQAFNSDTAKNSKMLFNPDTGKTLSANAEKDPITSAMTWVVHDRGKIVFRGDLQKMYDLGYVSAENKATIDANKSRANGLTMDKVQISNTTKEGKIKDAQLKALNGKATEEKNVQLIRDKRRQATNAFAQDAWSSGIDIKVDPETGDVVTDKVLTQAQADYVNELAAKHGFKAALRKEKDGIDNGWFRFDTDGYRFGGVSENKNPGATGLSRIGSNTQPGKVMSRGEFDATITGGSSPDKSPGKAGGLRRKIMSKGGALEKTYEGVKNSLPYVAVPALGAIQETAGAINRTGLAVSKAAQIKMVENELSYDPKNKELLSKLAKLKAE